MPTSYRFVYAVAKDEKEAEKIGLQLVSERLAACVNIFPIRSVYRWKGKIERSREAVMIAKTRKALVGRLIHRIRELHSYELPCIVSLKIEGGLQEFLRWIGESTSEGYGGDQARRGPGYSGSH